MKLKTSAYNPFLLGRCTFMEEIALSSGCMDWSGCNTCGSLTGGTGVNKGAGVISTPGCPVWLAPGVARVMNEGGRADGGVTTGVGTGGFARDGLTKVGIYCAEGERKVCCSPVSPDAEKYGIVTVSAASFRAVAKAWTLAKRR